MVWHPWNLEYLTNVGNPNSSTDGSLLLVALVIAEEFVTVVSSMFKMSGEMVTSSWEDTPLVFGVVKSLTGILQGIPTPSSEEIVFAFFDMSADQNFLCKVKCEQFS